MPRFNTSDNGYRALQAVVQDVWNALDAGSTAAEAFKGTSWRTVEIDVSSRTGWDVATSLTIDPADEPDVAPPAEYRQGRWWGGRPLKIRMQDVLQRLIRNFLFSFARKKKCKSVVPSAPLGVPLAVTLLRNLSVTLMAKVRAFLFQTKKKRKRKKLHVPTS